MKPYKYLFFDLDGTLTDSALGIVRSAQYALSHFGIYIADLKSLYPFVGPPLEDSFKEFYNFSSDMAQAAVKVYRERYETVGIHENAPYPGASDCLNTLKQNGFHLVIATSKMKRMAESVLNSFNLRTYFEFVGGRDDEGRLHTKADVIRDIIKELNLEKEKEHILMIGDRKYDIIGAREVGLDTVGVLFGYGSRKELEDAGATWLVEDYGTLINILSQN